MREESASQRHNTNVITTLDGGSQNRTEYASQIQAAMVNDKRPIIQFFALLNATKPYDRHDTDKLPEAKLVEMMSENSGLCMEVFRFEAFPRDLLPPLHYMCALSMSLPTIKLCFKHCNSAIFHDDSSMGAPIHFACMFNASLDVVQWLAKKNPDALELDNAHAKMTPLHLACQYEADFETVAYLTNRCPSAAKLVDKDGMTPLHWAASVDEPDLSVVEDLTEVNADACIQRDTKHGSTPLLYAIHVHADPPVIRDIIAAQPDCASLVDTNGNTPLYHAILMMAARTSNTGGGGGSSIRHGGGENDDEDTLALDLIGVLKDLMLADKTCVKVADERTGNLPVHTAVVAGITDMKVYQLLARKYSAGLEETNKDGLTPHELAQQVWGDDDDGKGKQQQYADIIEFLNPFEAVP